MAYTRLNLQEKYENILNELLNKIPYAVKGVSPTYFKLPYMKQFSTGDLAKDIEEFLPEGKRDPESKLNFLNNDENKNKFLYKELEKIENGHEYCKLIDYKLNSELKFYTDSIKKNGIDYIIANAKEIADKQEVRNEIISFPRYLTDEEFNTINNKENLIDYIYNSFKEKQKEGFITYSNFDEFVYDKVDCLFDNRLLERAYNIGKTQINKQTFSIPSANQDFMKILDYGEIKKDSPMQKNMEEKYKLGQKDAIKDKLNFVIKYNIPEEDYKRNKTYIESLKYDERETEFDNFYDLDSKINLLKHIPELDKINSNVKVFVTYSESNRFKENEPMSLDEFKDKYNKALNDLKLERERLGMTGGYDKTGLIILFDDGQKIVSSTNELRADIGDYESCDSYLKNGFANKNISEAIEEFENKQSQEDEESEEMARNFYIDDHEDEEVNEKVDEEEDER